jgi:hypothetical protein
VARLTAAMRDRREPPLWWGDKEAAGPFFALVVTKM